MVEVLQHNLALFKAIYELEIFTSRKGIFYDDYAIETNSETVEELKRKDAVRIDRIVLTGVLYEVLLIRPNQSHLHKRAWEIIKLLNDDNYFKEEGLEYLRNKYELDEEYRDNKGKYWQFFHRNQSSNSTNILLLNDLPENINDEEIHPQDTLVSHSSFERTGKKSQFVSSLLSIEKRDVKFTNLFQDFVSTYCPSDDTYEEMIEELIALYEGKIMKSLRVDGDYQNGDLQVVADRPDIWEGLYSAVDKWKRVYQYVAGSYITDNGDLDYNYPRVAYTAKKGWNQVCTLSTHYYSELTIMKILFHQLSCLNFNVADKCNSPGSKELHAIIRNPARRIKLSTIVKKHDGREHSYDSLGNFLYEL